MKLRLGLGVLGVVGLVACGSGSAGPTGPQGLQGPPGQQGQAGSSGGGGTASISGVEPSVGYLARTIHVTLSGYGTSWTSATTIDFGAGITVANVHAASPTALVADVTIDGAATLGPRDVVVTDGATKETYSQSFTIAPPATVQMEGSLAQGAVAVANVQLNDITTPFDTTGSTDPLSGQTTYTNLAVTAPKGVTAIIETATPFSVQVLFEVDVDAPAAAADFSLVSGPAGDASDPTYPAPGALTVAARKATALGTSPASGTIKTAYDSALYTFTPGASLSIVDLLATSSGTAADPGFVLLPKSGHFADIVGFFDAESGDGTNAATTLLPTSADPYYVIYWDGTGSTGAYTVGATTTAPAATAATTAADGSKAGAVDATALPFVLTGGNLTSETATDWVKVTIPANGTLHVQTVGDSLTDLSVSLYETDGTTPVGDAFDSGGLVDTTFGPVTSAGTYYVVFSAGVFYDPADGTYQAILRLQ
ncbi:MAG TPA: hypothetical protein VGG39_13725 [Polyangiaceae bacterium]|jgi:hypothetical protein